MWKDGWVIPFKNAKWLESCQTRISGYQPTFLPCVFRIHGVLEMYTSPRTLTWAVELPQQGNTAQVPVRATLPPNLKETNSCGLRPRDNSMESLPRATGLQLEATTESTPDLHPLDLRMVRTDWWGRPKPVPKRVSGLRAGRFLLVTRPSVVHIGTMLPEFWGITKICPKFSWMSDGMFSLRLFKTIYQAVEGLRLKDFDVRISRK